MKEVTGFSMEDCENEVNLSISRLFYWAAYCDKYGGEVKETPIYGTVLQFNEPVGVIGIACPDRFPLLGFVSLVAPAIARGNAVIAVPSKRYPTLAASFYQVTLS